MAKKEKLSLEELLEQTMVPKEDQPYELPENWVWCYLKNVIVNYDSMRVPLSQSQRSTMNKLYDYYGASGIIDKVESYIFDKRLLLIGEDGANLVTRSKPIAFIADGEYWVNNHAHVIDSNGSIIIDFLCNYINSIDLTPFITGSAQPKMTQEKMNTIPVPLPPLPEQQRIVALIESLFEKLDRAKELAQNALDSFENRKSAIFHKAFRGELTNILREKISNVPSAIALLEEIDKEKSAIGYNKPTLGFDFSEIPFKVAEGWTWCNLGRLIYKIEAGKNFSCPEIPVIKGKVGLVKISAVTWGKFDYTETKTVTDESKINKSHFIKKGDFLFSRANTIELVGSSVIVDDIDHDIMISDKVWRVKFFRGLEKYANYYLKSIQGRKEIEKRATGNQLSMRNISQDSFRNILIPLPPLDEQKEIVRILDNLLENEQKAKELCDVIDKIDHMKKAILARAFRGELSTNNPDEESALELLKEVLKEKG